MFFISDIIYILFTCFNKWIIKRILFIQFFFNSMDRALISNLNLFNFLKFRLILLLKDAFICDFIQKKTCDFMIRKFFIFSTYISNERFFSDYLLKLSLNYILIFLQRYFFYSLFGHGSIILFILLIFIIIFLLCNMLILFILIF